MIAIRFATSADARHIAQLHANSWRTAYADALSAEYLNQHANDDRLNLWNQRLTNPTNNQRVIVLQESDVLLGFGCMFLNADPQWGTLLDNLHVTPSRHRTGLGTMLMMQVRHIASQKYPSLPIHLGVIKTNSHAQRFYQSLGGRQEDEYIWNSPDGGQVPCFLYAWANPAAIKHTD